ncbi:MAG: carbohydrate kinase family protein [Caldisericaceae bacterium]
MENSFLKDAANNGQPSLIAIGDNAFDIIIKANIGFEGESNVFPEKRLLAPAGSGINFAFAASKLGINAFYFTPISKDPFGQKLQKFLQENNIDYYPSFSEKDTPLIFTLLNESGGRNTIAMIQNTSYIDISCREFTHTKMRFDWAYISGGIITEEAPQREVVCIAKKLVSDGAKIFFDPQFRIGKSLIGFFETSVSLINLSYFVFMNDREMKELPEALLRERIASGTTFVIKRGENGAMLLSKDLNCEVQGLKVATIDTTAAGDIFNAAFMRCFALGKTQKKCLEYANTVAALSTEKLGIFVPQVKL